MQQADDEADPNLRRFLAIQALALAQLAEETERLKRPVQVIADAIIWNRLRAQQQSGPGTLEAAENPLDAELAAREVIKRLASAGYKIVPAHPFPTADATTPPPTQITA
jgi:hypothetical protein